MTKEPLAVFLTTVRPDAHAMVRALAAAIEAAGVAFDQRFTYNMLVYTLDARWHRWAVAISVSSKAVSLRFLFGQSLADPAGVMRPGSTTAAFIDYPDGATVDAALVTAYVREAAVIHERG
jgi:hypothetical protein